MRNFVSTYDYKKNTVSLTVNANAPTGTAVVHHTNPWHIFWAIFGTLIGLLFLFCVFRFCKKTCAKKKNSKTMDKYY